MKKIKTLCLTGFVLEMMFSTLARAEDISCAAEVPTCDVFGFSQNYDNCEGMRDTVACPANGMYVGESKFACTCSTDNDCQKHYKCEEGACVAADDCAVGEKGQDVDINALYENPDLYNGRYNTNSMVEANAGDAGNTFVQASVYEPTVSGNVNEEFQAGTWYIPALGEWLEVYGFEFCSINDENFSTEKGSSENFAKVKASLQQIAESESLDKSYWTSTPSAENAYIFGTSDGSIDEDSATTEEYPARYFNLLDNAFCADDPDIAVGDIIFNEYVAGEIGHLHPEAFDSRNQEEYKTPVGVVVWVSESKHSVKIVSLTEGTDAKWTGVDEEENPKIPVSVKKYSQSDLIDALYMEGKCKNIPKVKENVSPFTDEFYKGPSNTETLANEECTSGGCQGSLFKSVSNTIEHASANYWKGKENNKYLGKGNWYIPSLGEWVEIRGWSQSQMNTDAKQGTAGGCETASDCAQGTAGVSPKTIPAYLANKLNLTSKDYWTSTEEEENKAWLFNPSNGYRNLDTKQNQKSIRLLNYLDNVFYDEYGVLGSNIKIGDYVCYSDEEGITYDTSDCGSTPIGVVVWKSTYGQSAKIMSMDDIAGVSWAPEQRNIQSLSEYVPTAVEKIFGLNTEGYTSCSQINFETKWGPAPGQTSNNAACGTSSDVYKEVPAKNGSTLKCYAPQCACTNDQVYSVAKKCETFYLNCEQYASMKNNDYETPSSERDVACYPTLEEAMGQGSNANQIITLSDYPVIVLSTGYKERCFPGYMDEGYSNDAHREMCRAYGMFRYLDSSENEPWCVGGKQMKTYGGGRCGSYKNRTVACCAGYVYPP